MKLESSQIIAWASFAILIVGGLIRMGRQLERIINLLEEQGQAIKEHDMRATNHGERITALEYKTGIRA